MYVCPFWYKFPVKFIFPTVNPLTDNAAPLAFVNKNDENDDLFISRNKNYDIENNRVDFEE